MLEILWFFCGIVAAALAAYVDFLEAKQKNSRFNSQNPLDNVYFEYDLTLTKIILGGLLILGGPVSLAIVSIRTGVTYCDKKLFKISIKKKGS